MIILSGNESRGGRKVAAPPRRVREARRKPACVAPGAGATFRMSNGRRRLPWWSAACDRINRMVTPSAAGRNRVTYACVTALVVVAGLGSRSRWAVQLPSFVATYAGDTLWALMIYLCFGFVFPRARVQAVALAALSMSFAIEVSELYQAEWINRIRSTPLGGLVLGFGFKWSDLVCYATGILMGVTAESWAAFRLKRSPANRRTPPS